MVLQIALAFTRYEAFVTTTVLDGALAFGELLLQALARTIARQTADSLARTLIDIAPWIAGRQNGKAPLTPIAGPQSPSRFGPGATFRRVPWSERRAA